MPIGKSIPDLGDSQPISDASLGLPGSSFAPSLPASGPVTPSFGSAAVNNFSTAPTNTSQGPVLTNAAASNAASGADVLIKADDKFGNFVNSKWRPLMAFIYMITCSCDFVVFPVLWSVLQAMTHGNVTSQWQPLTLQGAGLYHLAMGAVLGVAAYGRTKEKVAGAA
jgi:Holin of 3TMs, for gene-transfer release